MCIDRFGKAERAPHQDLFRRVRKMILAADDVRDLHQRIVHHDGEVIERRSKSFAMMISPKSAASKTTLPRTRSLNSTLISGNFETDDLPGFCLPAPACSGSGRCISAEVPAQASSRAALRCLPLCNSSNTRRRSRSAAADIFYRWRSARSGDTDRTRLSRHAERELVAVAHGCGPSSHFKPSQESPCSISSSYRFSERSLSVSSMRKISLPPYLRAKSQLKSAVRALPMCIDPVGLGAKRTRMDFAWVLGADASIFPYFSTKTGRRLGGVTLTEPHIFERQSFNNLNFRMLRIARFEFGLYILCILEQAHNSAYYLFRV